MPPQLPTKTTRQWSHWADNIIQKWTDGEVKLQQVITTPDYINNNNKKKIIVFVNRFKGRQGLTNVQFAGYAGSWKCASVLYIRGNVWTEICPSANVVLVIGPYASPLVTTKRVNRRSQKKRYEITTVQYTMLYCYTNMFFSHHCIAKMQIQGSQKVKTFS